MAADDGTPDPEVRGPALQLEVSRSELPRLDGPAQDASRLAGTIGANDTTRLDITGWAWPQGRAGLGLALGMEQPSAPRARTDPRLAGSAGSSVDLGVRWRWTLEGGGRIAMAASRRVAPSAQDALSMIENSQQAGLYRAHIELQFVSARSRGITPEFGAIGMQLDSGARLSLRTKRGKPMLYYRARF